MAMESEVRLGRNYVRAGDLVKVKLPTKTQFRSGFVFKGYDPIKGVALVREPTRLHERYVTLEAIQRVAQTRNGQRKQAR